MNASALIAIAQYALGNADCAIKILTLIAHNISQFSFSDNIAQILQSLLVYI